MNSEANLARLFVDVERRLFRGLSLDVWERVVYWHLLLHTHAEGKPSVVFGLDPLAEATAMSTTKLRETLRSMAQKGCVAIDERSRLGHTIRVLLPDEIATLPEEPSAPESVDIETIDFYAGRQFVGALIQREQSRCFYCLAGVTTSTAVLDHCVPQVNGGDNTYRNVVISCHGCNARKQGIPPEDRRAHVEDCSTTWIPRPVGRAVRCRPWCSRAIRGILAKPGSGVLPLGGASL